MTRVEEFDAFYHGSREHILHLAYAQSGDLAAAAAGTEDAYARAWQHWPKIRTRDPLGDVRSEAMRLATLRHNAHVWRRRTSNGPDSEILDALAELPTLGRRLVLLQSAGGLDIARAAREVALPVDDAVSATDKAVTTLEQGLAVGITDVERRIDGLRESIGSVDLRRVTTVRRAGQQRQRRRTLVAVTGSALALVAAGVLVGRTPTDPHIGQTTSPRGSGTAHTVTAAQLLLPEQLTRLDPRRRWHTMSTSSDPSHSPAYAACQPRAASDPRPRATFLRTFASSSHHHERVFQTAEVSRTAAAAAAAHRRAVHWYAGCQVPRMQLLASYSVPRSGTDETILVLRRWSHPVQTLTVGLTRSGVVTSTILHSIDRPRGPSVSQFAQTLDDGLSMVCASSGGGCGGRSRPVPSSPPPTGDALGFLGVVDLPPVATLTKRWVGTRPAPATTNPSATVCDRANFSVGSVTAARARVFVIPRAPGLPKQFGISETVGSFDHDSAAAAFVGAASERVRTCARKNLTATVSATHIVRRGPVRGTVWRLSFAVNRRTTVVYRLGLVRNGGRVAEVAFSPAGKYDMSAQAFDALALRAGQRLTELPGPSR